MLRTMCDADYDIIASGETKADCLDSLVSYLEGVDGQLGDGVKCITLIEVERGVVSRKIIQGNNSSNSRQACALGGASIG